MVRGNKTQNKDIRVLKRLMWSIADQYREYSSSPYEMQIIMLGTFWMAHHYNLNENFSVWVDGQTAPSISGAIQFLLPDENNTSVEARKYLSQSLNKKAHLTFNEVFHIASELKATQYDFQGISETVRAIILRDADVKEMHGFYSARQELRELYSLVIDVPQGARILDPAAGLGYALGSLDLKGAKSIQLNDINMHACVMIRLLWSMHDRADVLRVDNYNALDRVEDWSKSIDILICEPPFGTSTIDPEEKSTEPSNVTEAFVWFAMEALSDQGRAYIVVPDWILYSPRSKKLRKALIKEDILESVIGLPAGLFAPYTEINTNLLVLNKDKNPARHGKIAFYKVPLKLSSESKRSIIDIDTFTRTYQQANISAVVGDSIGDTLKGDASLEIYSNIKHSFVREESASYSRKDQDIMTSWFNLINCEDTMDQENILMPARYMGATEEQLLEQLRPGDRLIKLQDVLTRIDLPKLSTNEDSSSFAYYTPQAIPQRPFDPPEPDVVSTDTNITGIRMLNEDAVIIAHGNNTSKAFFYHGNTAIALSSRLDAWKLDETKVIPEFFITEFTDDFVQSQIRKFLYGSVTKRISDSDFESLSLRLPDIMLQETDIRHEKERIIEQKNAELQELRRKLQLEDRGFEVLTNFKHDFMGNLDDLSSGFKLLNKYLVEKSDLSEPMSLTDSIVPDNTSEQWVLKNWLERFGSSIHSVVDKLDKEVENMKFDLETFEPVETDIQKLITEILHNYDSTPNCDFIVNRSAGIDEDLITPVDKRMMSSLVDNLVRNALKHGFSDKDKKYQIIFKIGLKNEATRQYVMIEYMNNGSAFPSGFTFTDFIQRGKRAGKTRGSGIGGDRIYRIVHKHGGVFREFIHTESRGTKTDGDSYTYPIHYEILIPFEN